MASALNPENKTQTQTAKTANPPPTTSPRKRRKRTTGNGAADDCFTCASRKTKCDRRRPYCTQCLELGGNCSGYKTTLTWGVGVASRGKLRGFALPVSNDPKKKDATQATPREKPKKKAAVDEWRDQQRPGQLPGATPLKRDAHGDVKGFPTVATGTSTSNPSNTLQHAYYQNAISSEPLGHQINPSVGTYPMNVAGGNASDSRYNLSGRTSVLVAPPSLTRPISTTAQAPYPYHQAISNEPATHMQPSQIQPNFAPWSHLPNSATELPYQPGFVAPENDEADDDDIEEISLQTASHAEQLIYQYPNSNNRWVSQSTFPFRMPPQLNLNQSIGQTPRLRYLISYYAEVISPVIVAFDGPTNPYKTHVLQLARESKTLQHAIAALSASNLRQRLESNTLSKGRTLPARKSSMAHCAMTESAIQSQFGIVAPVDQMKEESFHQRAAIQSLNAQLADPVRRRADSVLATLLILSLFHICDSGVAKFQTQFAGVKKLLSLRGAGSGSTSDESKWFTRMFTWFDVLTATTNDREGQLQGSYLDMTTVSDDEWPLENLVGCDGRLFKTVSRLNRLNVLGQNKPVSSDSTANPPVASASLPPLMTHFTAHPQVSQYFPELYTSTPITAAQRDPDSRTEFWREWRSIRRDLESWRLDTQATPYNPYNVVSPTVSDASSPSTGSSSSHSSSSSAHSIAQVAPENLPDLSNISESFRYSALLYTERLGDPHLPSSHPRFQNLVLIALHYISAVQSDVCLLWPLFVTGTECVFESQRNVIRQRCEDIQKDSGFFNNISCLELLEKIWAAADAKNNAGHNGENETLNNPAVYHVDETATNNPGNTTEVSKSSTALVPGGQAFPWRIIMDEEGLQGEYIVV